MTISRAAYFNQGRESEIMAILLQSDGTLAQPATHAPDTQDGQTVKVPCEVFSRIVGYIRPIESWNDGKQQEFADRKLFDGALSSLERDSKPEQ